MTDGLSFEQLKSLIHTDFFTIDQVKEIRSALLKKEAPKISLTEEQVKHFWKLSQGFQA